MLYERWRDVAAARASGMAFQDASGRSWTFAELAARAHEAPTQSMQFPQVTPAGSGGLGLFLVGVLAAWRDGAPCCPLEAGQPRPDIAAPPGGIAHLKQTSATTGAARFVAFTEAQLAADAEQIVATMGLRPEWPNVSVISLAHSYGFSNLVLPLLLHGIPILEPESALPDGLRRAAAGASDLTLPAVPALWRAWHEARALPPNVRLAISAGAPLPLPLERAVFEEAGLKIHNFYGASECGGIAYDVSNVPRAKAACVGAPMLNVRLAIDAEGCLEVRSPAVGLGYWPEAQPGLGDGCYRTSDLAELNDGMVHLRGRAGDLINVAGRKVAPESIERVLLAHPAVKDGLVFGAPSGDAGRGEDIIACVVTRDREDAEALRQFLLERLPAWQVPRRWHFVETLAPNARGKLSRAEWRQRLEPRGGTTPVSDDR